MYLLLLNITLDLTIYYLYYFKHQKLKSEYSLSFEVFTPKPKEVCFRLLTGISLLHVINKLRKTNLRLRQLTYLILNFLVMLYSDWLNFYDVEIEIHQRSKLAKHKNYYQFSWVKVYFDYMLSYVEKFRFIFKEIFLDFVELGSTFASLSCVSLVLMLESFNSLSAEIWSCFKKFSNFTIKPLRLDFKLYCRDRD